MKKAAALSHTAPPAASPADCQHLDVMTVNSRVEPDRTVRRRRGCLKCGLRWTTMETRVGAAPPRPSRRTIATLNVVVDPKGRIIIEPVQGDAA
jgi:hypothetical protein